MNTVWEKRRKRLFEIIEIGSNYDAVCWGYDFFNTFTILLNLTVSIMYTFDNMELKYGPLLLTLERLTVAFFAIDFVLCSLLYAIFLPVRGGGIPYASHHSNLPAVPYQ